MKTGVLLSTHSLSMHFGSGDTIVRAVNDVDISINYGELVLIMGPSGSGKTTLLSMMGTLLRPTNGAVLINGINVSDLEEKKLPQIRANNIGFIFQSFNLLDALSVEENILLPASLLPGGIIAARPRCLKLMEQLGLLHRKRARPKTLSGGEKQRVAIARALINKPALILADEPTGNLDSQKGQDVMMILHDIVRDENCTVIMVTHDNRVEDIADRKLWLEDGELRDRKSELHNWVRDPVCGMRVDEWTALEKQLYKQHVYIFCSHKCADRFRAEPEKYTHELKK